MMSFRPRFVKIHCRVTFNFKYTLNSLQIIVNVAKSMHKQNFKTTENHYENTPMQYTEIFFQKQKLKISLEKV